MKLAFSDVLLTVLQSAIYANQESKEKFAKVMLELLDVLLCFDDSLYISRTFDAIHEKFLYLDAKLHFSCDSLDKFMQLQEKVNEIYIPLEVVQPPDDVFMITSVSLRLFKQSLLEEKERNNET